MRQYFATAVLAIALSALAVHVWGKDPGSNRSGGSSMQGTSGGSGQSFKSGQNFNKSPTFNTNKSWNQDNSKSWKQDTTKSWDQNKAVPFVPGMNQSTDQNKTWMQDKNKPWTGDMKGQLKFDANKHPDFTGGPGIHDNWRYRWLNGRWWFWAPDNRWSWYNDGRWSYYDTYAVQRPIIENFSGGPIKIINPATNQVPLNYSLNGTTFTIRPGYSQELQEDRQWTIQFSRGPDMNVAEYGLRSGVYKFARTSRGWELFRYDFQDFQPPDAPSAPMNPPVQ